MTDTDENLYGLRCWDCANSNQRHDYCAKRIDHKSVKYAKPWFKCYDGNFTICSDFEPNKIYPRIVEAWKGFEYYWEWHKKYGIPYGNTDINVYFTLRDDTSIRYGVKLIDYVYGTMIENGVLKANEKMYYKQDRSPNGFGYKLVREKINGVKI